MTKKSVYGRINTPLSKINWIRARKKTQKQPRSFKAS